MCSTIAVGMGEIKIAKFPNSLAAYGVGSCVIVFIYDPQTKLGGGAHIMLPDSSGLDKKTINQGKFSDTAIALLLKTMSEEKINTSNLQAKIAGGSEMFPPTEDFSTNIGKENAETVKKALADLGIPLVAEDIGGTRGRTMKFNLDNGIAEISIIGQETKEL